MNPTDRRSKESPAFARKAGSYDAYANVQADSARCLAEWLPTNSPKACCLELGAGTGLFSQYLKDRFQSLECSDIASEMLLHLGERLPGVRCRVLDAWAAPHPDAARFDFLTSCSLLQWAPSPVAVLRNWAGRMEAGGRMLVGWFVAPSLPELDHVLNGQSPVNWRSPEQWQEAIAAAGLKLERIDSTTHRYNYPSALKFWKSLHGTGCNVSRGTSTGTLRRLLREYESAFKTDSGVCATWTFCRAELSKLD